VLGRVDRRLRAGAVLRGLGASALVAALGAAAGMAVDVARPLPGWARWGVWGAWVLAVGGLLAAALARAAARRAKVVELAAVIERSRPELGERLTGAVGLLGRRDAHGSPALIAALAEEASAHVGEADPARAVPLAGPWRRVAVGAAAIAVVAAPAVARPDPFGRLARRFLMPWSATERVGRFAVAVRPGDTVAGLGDDLAVTAEVAPRFGRASGPAPGDAWLEWSDAETGRTRRVAMTMDAHRGVPASGAFRATLPGLTGSLSYRVVAGRSGEGESRWFRVEAVEPPAVSALAARVEPPSYTKFPARDARDPARVEAWEGSRVALTVTASRPLRSAEVEWPSSKPGGRAESRRVAATLGPDGRSATVSLPAEVSGGFAVALLDTLGIVSRPEPPRRLVVRPDAPPSVALKGVEGLDEARPDDTLRVGVLALDDVAVASAELHYTVERAGSGTADGSSTDNTGHVDARLAGLGTPAAAGTAVLGLKGLNLRPGDAVSYRVRVADNRPAPRGPNLAWSAPRRLAVVANAPPLRARRSQADREAVQNRLDALKKATAENRHETELLRYAADAALRGNGAWDPERRQALADREAAARGVAERLGELARDLDDDPAFQPLGPPARQAADAEAEAARAALDRARLADDAPRRLADLRQADARLGALAARLEDLQRRFDALAKTEPAPGDPRDPKGGRAGPGVAEPDELRALQEMVRAKTGRAWGELPGHLRTEILQMSQGRYRDDYARLIQLYFREIAAGADSAPPGGARP
jgi:hypothetical protein